ncbi:Cadherin [Trinorchestia longiramus]|nr:Cadherin [Trinorchestia longiramus]
MLPWKGFSKETPLDRDPPFGRSSYHLTVTASDGRSEANASVVINIKDINDNPPLFPSSVVLVSIMENSPPGTLVSVVSAHDQDDPEEGGNAQISYLLQENAIDETSGSPLFAVEENTGAILSLAPSLDREHTERFALVLVAKDGGGLKSE